MMFRDLPLVKMPNAMSPSCPYAMIRAGLERSESVPFPRCDRETPGGTEWFSIVLHPGVSVNTAVVERIRGVRPGATQKTPPK